MLLEFDSLEREHKQILQAIRSYYEQFPSAEHISVDELQVFFHQLNPAIKDSAIYDLLFDEIRRMEISNEALLDTALQTVADRHFATRAMSHLIKFVNGESPSGMEAVAPLLDEYRSLIATVGQKNPDESTKPLHQIMEEIRRDGLPWGIPFLNESIGPVYPGTLGHILARPETGKTAFCVASAAWFAYQLRGTEDKVLYLSNEENVDRTRSRIYASLLGQPVDTLITMSREDLERVFATKGGKNLHVVGQVTTIAKVEANIVMYKPRVVYVDQGPKVVIPGNFSSVEARQILYNRYRDLANRYHLIFITVGQADAAAENKKWLSYNHIDGSKVGIPGECDYIIGIGRDENDTNEDYRYFNISKNKLGFKLRRYTGRIDIKTNRYEAV